MTDGCIGVQGAHPGARKAGRAVGCLFAVAFGVAVLAAAGAAWTVSVRLAPIGLVAVWLGDRSFLMGLAWFVALLVVFSRLFDFLWKVLGLTLMVRADRRTSETAADAFVRGLFVESRWGSRRRRLI